jgi:hypothetical protein
MIRDLVWYFGGFFCFIWQLVGRKWGFEFFLSICSYKWHGMVIR